MHLMGIDVGTTGCKAVVFTDQGHNLGSGFRGYEILTDKTGKAEQDAEQVWKAVLEVIKESIIRSGTRDIKALSVSVQGDAIIPVDRGFRPLHPAVLGMDYRSKPQARACAQKFGERNLFQKTGMHPHPLNSLPKILWLRENAPDVFQKAWKITTYADYIMGRLGAGPVIDYTMASRTMAFDLYEKRWSLEILDELELSEECLSRAVPSCTQVGKVHPKVAEETGLPSDTLLVTGGHDQVCAALGSGVIREGQGVVSTGTAEVLSTVFPAPVLSDDMFENSYPCYMYAREDTYFTFSLNHVGGLLLRWYRNNFCEADVQRAQQQGRDPYDYLIDRMPEGPSRVFFLPHLNGSGNPACDTSSRGAVIGVTMSTDRYEIVRAILESQSYELRMNFETFRKIGIEIQQLSAVGGGAKSPAWLQIKADILNHPVNTLKVSEAAACLGAALIAGKASDIYTSLEEGINTTVKVHRTFEPDSERASIYEEWYSLYREVYPSLIPLYRKMTYR
ncbi:MAG: FGGY-family carbohydrate kinase [Spirochaetota bacterium]